MKRLGLVIAAVAALCVGAQPIAALAQAKVPPITAKQREQGKAEAPAAIAAAKVNCTIADAYVVQSGQDPKTKAKTASYEVACQEGPGYVIQTSGDTAQSFDCLALETAVKQNPKGGSYTCRLEPNLDTKVGFGKLATTAGKPCTATGARYIGSSPETSYFEVSCAGDKGYVIENASGKPPTVSDCLSVLGGQLECKLTTKEQVLGGLTKLIAPAGKPCQVSNARPVGVDKASGSSYVEVACSGGGGYIVQASAKDEFQNAVECAKAQGIGGGCSLTVIDETAEAGTYTKLAQGAGFPCDVSKYRFLGKEPKSNSEIVELACKNRPDGGIGMFPISGGQAKVFDCVQGGSLGVACQLTQPAEGLYTKYTDRLVQAGKNQCKVTGARYLASTTSGADLIETACSDGAPGFVISIDHTSGKTNELLTCGQATRAGAACALPTNIAKK